MQWKIYFGDGSTFSSDQGSPSDAPTHNIQIILEATEKEGVIRLAGKEYYWHDDDLGQWCAGDYSGMMDYVLRCTTVKVARSMRTCDFDALFQVCVDDPDFKPKSMRNYPREGPPTRGELP